MLMELEIVNLVATGDLKQPVDLLKLSELRNVDYDKSTYGGKVAYLKTENMLEKVSIFSSGKLISVGTTTREQAKHDLKDTVDTLTQANLIKPVSVTANVRNIVALLTLPNPIPLEQLEEPNTVYEPEQFPAAILKMNDPKATFLIFNSGKIIISGTKTEDELRRSAELIKEIISQIDE
jgi:transcription initiation factor TFIID TATA-box-binding protein